MKCVACCRDAPTVTDAEIAEFHPQIPDRVIVELDGVRRLSASSLDDFAQALEFTRSSQGGTASGESKSPETSRQQNRRSAIPPASLVQVSRARVARGGAFPRSPRWPAFWRAESRRNPSFPPGATGDA